MLHLITGWWTWKVYFFLLKFIEPWNWEPCSELWITKWLGMCPGLQRRFVGARSRDINSFVVSEMWLDHVSEKVMAQICTLDSVGGGGEGNKCRDREMSRETVRSRVRYYWQNGGTAPDPSLHSAGTDPGMKELGLVILTCLFLSAELTEKEY